MTIITKPITDKKSDTLDEPLVDNEQVEDLPPKVDLEAGTQLRPQYFVLKARARRVSIATTVCIFLTALLVMSVGIIGGAYLYRQFARSQMHRFRGWCTIPYEGTKATMYMDDQTNPNQHHASHFADHDLFKSLTKSSQDEDKSNGFFQEEFEIDLENEKYEKINVPDFRDGQRGRFIHDFSSNKTGIIDMDGHRCFVMPLNRQRVLLPRSMFDLIRKLWDGSYEVDTDVVRETMRVVTPPITDFENVGYYISRECSGFPTYMLEKVTTSVFKRSAEEDNKLFAVYAGDKILQFNIVNVKEAIASEAVQSSP
ncbi:integral membrane protein 2B [Zootermopsis nevadensis]|uniref:Integral membrane protein 2 n=1 Tax=Zootermopsis nevadensis TaxID=136037 RepID=A0A067QX28_ZOONE|nr:integral membrane protein 2B [Zootermopsis nevadensis]KDR10662.1 Integral membrane protein 2B [Zootermopsis nevadensis]